LILSESLLLSWLLSGCIFTFIIKVDEAEEVRSFLILTVRFVSLTICFLSLHNFYSVFLDD
jgi:hypothetical protein